MTHIPTELRPLLERCAKRLAAMMQGDLSRELEALLADHSEDALGLVAQPAAQAVSGAGFDYSIKTATSDSIGKPNAPADGEAVEVVGWMHSATRSVTEDAVRASTWISECVSPLMTVAQHQRIVAQLGQKVECRECERKQREIDLLWSDRRKDADLIHQLRTALAYFQPTVRQLAETSAELRAELSALKARQVEQEPAGEVHLWTGGGISLLHVELAQPLPPGTKLYTAPQPAQAQDAAGLPYQTLFNAIAAATKASAGHVEISVAEFKAALAASTGQEVNHEPK